MKRFAFLAIVLAFLAATILPAPATVTTDVTVNRYIGSGTLGPFSYKFKIWSASDLVVIKKDPAGTETVLTLNTDYTVTGVGVTTGGTVLLKAVLPAGYTITIMRAFPYLQSQNWTSTNAITALSLNNLADKLEHQIQQLKEDNERSFSVPRSSTLKNLHLDSSANKLIGWDSSGTALKNYSTTSVSVPVIDHIGNHADSIETAISDVGAALQAVLVNKAVTLTAGGTVPENMELWIPKGGLINLAGYNLDIQGPFTAGNYQVFSGTGNVTFTKGLVGRVINPLWWYDGADLSTAVSAAVESGGEHSYVAMHNVSIPITAGVSCDVKNYSTYDFTGSTITSDSELTMLDLNNGAMADASARAYKVHVKLPDLDSNAATKTSSIGLLWRSVSRAYIEEGTILEHYIGAMLLPHDFMHIRGTKFQHNVIQVKVDSTWFTKTHPIGTTFEDTIFTNKSGLTEHGLLWIGPFNGMKFTGFSSNGDVTISDFHFQNASGAVLNYDTLLFQDGHLEQGSNGIKRFWFEDTSSATRKYQHITFDNVNMSVPRYGTGIHMENGRYIRVRNCTLGSGAPVTISNATTTSGSAVVTTPTANKFLMPGVVDSSGLDPKTQFVASAAFPTTKSYTNYKLVWLTGSNAGQWSYISLHTALTREFTLLTTMPNDIVATDTFQIMLIDVGWPVWGSGFAMGTTVASVDSGTQFTASANCDSTRSAKTVIVEGSTPAYFDVNTEDIIIDGHFTTGDGKIIYACPRSEITFLPEERIVTGTPLASYNEHSVVGTENVTLDMQDEMGSQYPVDAHPRGYVIRVIANDTGSAASIKAQVRLAKDGTEIGTTGKYGAMWLCGVPDGTSREQDFYVEADGSGRIRLRATEETDMTLTLSVVKIVM